MYKVIYKRIAKIVFETRDVVGNLRKHIRFNCYHGLILSLVLRSSLVLLDCFFPFVFVVEKRVWWHSQYRVVSTHHDFRGVFMGKINNT